MVQIPSVDLNDDESRIIVRFDYNRRLVQAVSSMPGAKFKAAEKEPDKGELYWYFKADVDIARRIHDDLEPEMTPRFKRWAHEKLRRVRELASLSLGDTAELEVLPAANPKLYEMIHLGPKGPHMKKAERLEALRGPASFQAADVAFFSQVDGALNLNPPGSGKTLETIATAYEGGNIDSPNLIAGPVTSLNTVWGRWLRELQPHPVLVAPPGRDARIRVMQTAMDLADDGEPFWLVCNPAMVMQSSDFERCEDHINDHKAKKQDLRKCGVCKEVYFPPYPEFEEIEWGLFCFDEFHLAGIGETKTMTHRGARGITAERSLYTSGTPIGGKVIRLFGPLNLIDQKQFSSKWNFAHMWLTVVEESGYKKIEDIRPEMEQQFYHMLSTVAIKREEEDIMPWMPPIQIVDEEVEMTPKQAEQYAEFEEMAEIRIDEYKLSAVGILAEYARLKQFAGAVQRVEIRADPDPDKPPHIELHPTEDSPKLPWIMQKLSERGINGGDEDTGDEQVVIFSESERMVRMVYNYLLKRHIKVGMISGPVTPKRRDIIQEEFQAKGGPRVVVVQTQTGGVSITLDRASTGLFLDETWNPDDQYQAIKRLHRASRIHHVTAYFCRTTDTIQQLIQERVIDKGEINRKVLEFRKRGVFTKQRAKAS